MSYIHEALKKAQRERDGRYHKYSKTLLARPSQRSIFQYRAVWWGGVMVLFLMTGLGLYRWMYEKPSADNRKATPAVGKPMRPSQPERTSKATSLFHEARRSHKAGRTDEARRLYNEVLKMDPGYVDALNNLGVLWIQEKNYPEAKKNFYKAILLDARYVDPHYNLSCVYALEGDTSQSMAHLKKALALDTAVRQWAAGDPDLESLRELPQFQELVTEKKDSTPNP